MEGEKRKGGRRETPLDSMLKKADAELLLHNKVYFFISDDYSFTMSCDNLSLTYPIFILSHDMSDYSFTMS